MNKGFYWRLKTTDGSEPLELVQDEDGSMVYQGGNVVGAGKTLLEAWNDYLFPIGPGGAPVRDNHLHRMWSAYDKAHVPNGQGQESPTKTN